MSTDWSDPKVCFWRSLHLARSAAGVVEADVGNSRVGWKSDIATQG